MIRCSLCGAEHDLFSIEPRYARPDAYLRVPAEERDQRARCGDDWCRLRGRDAEQQQYFLRVTLPVQVLGETRQIHWGVWVEVTRPHYERVMELWDDPVQDREPPIFATLANALPGYPSTLHLPGTIQLIGPSRAPQFQLSASLDHPLAQEQRSGVYPERALEWVARFLH